MNSAEAVKTKWTWTEWLAGRKARRELARRVGAPVCRRQESSSDKRLRAAFDGERAPAQPATGSPPASGGLVARRGLRSDV